ncbi:MAG: YdeI/OmpD-associated family protein [bacterium]
MQKIYSVEEYIEKQDKWQTELNELRSILQTTELEETVKWSMPTYCIKGKNVLGIGAFKNHYCLWFHQGVFLKDEQKLLVNAQENKTKALRQMRFDNTQRIDKNVVLAYVTEAIENQKAGKELKPQRTKKTAINIPNELNDLFKENKGLYNAFQTLSPGKQKDYCEHIGSAKQEATRLRRLEKAIPSILAGKGLWDKYKNC